MFCCLLCLLVCTEVQCFGFCVVYSFVLDVLLLDEMMLGVRGSGSRESP